MTPLEADAPPVKTAAAMAATAPSNKMRLRGERNFPPPSVGFPRLKRPKYSSRCHSAVFLRSVRLRHRAVVERLVERLLIHARLAGDIAQGAPGARRFLDDLRCLVVADVRVQGGRR